MERRAHGRYAMHDLVRDYAATTALPDGAREAALARVVDFHLHTAFAADHFLDPHRWPVPLPPPAQGVRLDPVPDAEAAMTWLDVEHATQRTAAALGLHLVVWHFAWALDTFQLRRGHRHDALASWGATLDAAAHLPDPTTRSRARRFLAHACSRLGLHEEAVEHLAEAVALAERNHDPVEQANTLRALAFAREGRGDDRRALEHVRHALDLYRTSGESLMEAAALNEVGWYAARLGDFDTAFDHCHAALVLHRRNRTPAGEAATLDSLGYIAHHSGDHKQAVDHYDQALTLFRALGHTYEVANTLDNVGHPHFALGHHDRAREAWREALELYREHDRDADAERLQRQLHDLVDPP